MKRRDVIVGGVAAAAWPVAAWAQSPDQGPRTDKLRTIGVLMSGVENDPESRSRMQAFQDAMRDLGWVEGKTARFVYRWSSGQQERIEEYTAELAALKPDAILANSTPVVTAFKKATRTIPIVVALVIDPVGFGFVESLARPGGNITGFTFINPELIGKWHQLLVEAAPSITRSGLIFNPQTSPFYGRFVHDVDAAPGLKGKVFPMTVESLDAARSSLANEARTPGLGLIVGPDPFTVVNVAALARLSLQSRVPAISVYRQFAIEGGLMAYGPDIPEIFRRAAAYLDRVLKGAKPAELPIQQPTKFNLTINLKTAKVLGLTVPPTLLASADEVIE